MMTIEEMRQYRKETGLSYEEISKRSGVPFGTVQKVFSGTTRSPRHQTIEALSKVFEDIAHDRHDHLEYQAVQHQDGFRYTISKTAHPDQVAEPHAVYGSLAAKESWDGEADSQKNSDNDVYNDAIRSSIADYVKYPRQGEYTIQDYLCLPDDQRAELIDGVIYDMSSPSIIHQIILGQLHLAFANFVNAQGGPCEVLLSPMDVALDNDDKTIVEPDVMIICDQDKLHRKRVYGAPDLIVEILSPSTRRKDMTLKVWKYSNAGVREYWIVDPDKLQVMVYDFEHGLNLRTYTFQDKVPVGIYNGRLEVDFASIWKSVKRFYG